MSAFRGSAHRRGRPRHGYWSPTREGVELTANGDQATPGLLSSMWRFRWMSLAVVLAAGILSGGAGVLVAPRPSATATIALKNPGAQNVLARGVVGDASLARYTRQRADFLTSDDVLSVVSEGLPGHPVSKLRSEITVTASTTSNLLTITATSNSAADAVALANTLVDSYSKATRAQVKQLTSAA